jgi:hypothetical protein
MRAFVRGGVWVWGTVTVGLALASLIVVVVGALSLPPAAETCKFLDEPSMESYLGRLFYALKENNSLIAGILAFTGLAWSSFYKTYGYLLGLNSRQE